MSTWSPARRRFAAFAVLTATVTGALVVGLDGSGQLFAASAYVVITVAALFLPAGIAVQVITGQVLVANLLLGQDGPDPLLLMPVVAGVVVTAEQLAMVARFDTPIPRDHTDVSANAWLAAAIGGGVFGAVMLVSGVSGPISLVGVVAASGACIGIAALLMRDAA